MDLNKIANKWQKKWEDSKIFEVKESAKPKFYVLEMFPYPSGSGLHMGHAFNYTIGDIFARFKRMQGFNVLYPMGYDSLGLPAENAAIKEGINPKDYTEKSIKNFIQQQKSLGLSYDWTRMVKTHDPSYYKWDQWIFLKMFEKGLAFKKKAAVNWCSKCNSVLANEQVHNGKCWRHKDCDVEIKQLEQWFFKITDYAEELYDNIDKLTNWANDVKAMQKNWIGKSHGTEIDFEVPSNKTILVDAVHCLVDENGNVNKELKTYLDSFKNEKIILTNAPLEKHKKLFSNVNYKVFTLQNNPNKKNPEYYKIFLDKLGLNKSQVIYFEHDTESAESAKSIGIKTHLYKDLQGTKKFIEENLSAVWPIFTTRPDTIFGVTFMVISAQHPKLYDLVTKEQKNKVDNFIKKLKSTSEKDIETLDKEGVFTGSYAINPMNNEKIPVWAGNFVVADYGCGMVMAVPAHDQRDFEFAKKYNLPIKQVIAPYYLGTGVDAPRKSVETLNREIVDAIIENNRGEFLLIKENNNGIVHLHFVGGGTEGEDCIKALKKEIVEETGYNDFEIKDKVNSGTFVFAFRHTKNKNQKTFGPTYHVKLKTENKVRSEVDDGKHEIIWVAKDKVNDLITWPHHLQIWLDFVRGSDCFTGDGILVNSNQFNGLNSEGAIEQISKFLEKKKQGKRVTQYKLKDWLISRQRYWGTPIPIIYCPKCGTVPVPEKDLPVILPDKVVFGKGNPLVTNEKFVNVKCPNCGMNAKRETDTMDTFVNSSWYFLRYCDSSNSKEIFDRKKAAYWMPVDQYIGGKEHACMHLIYFRFYTKFLRDLGLIKIDEPTYNLFNQGMLHGSDGSVMSKSLGNVVLPEEISEKYGIDAARLFLVSIASPDKDIAWSDKGIENSHKLLNTVYSLYDKKKIPSDDKMKNKLHRTIKIMTNSIQNIEYNKSVLALTNFIEYLNGLEKVSEECLENLALLLSPVVPHLSEELWEKLGKKQFISLEKWPKYDEKFINDKLEFSEEVVSKTISDIEEVLKLANISKPKSIKLIVSEDWKYDYVKELKKLMTKIFNPGEILKELMKTDLKQYGQEISKLTPRLVSDQSKLPIVVLEQNEEFKAINEAKKTIETKFNAKVEIELAEKSKEQKSKQAFPGKPAIIIN